MFCSIYANAQCYLDRHTTNWFDSWVSCSTAPNPNPDLEDGHWILYDLKQGHTLYDSKIWNYNDPSSLDAGIREFQIDLSHDGISWEAHGVFELDQGTGDPLYEGETGPDFGETSARYILLTVLETWGNQCAALSEWSIQAEPENTSTSTQFVAHQQHPCLSIKLYPNPVVEFGQIILESSCSNPLLVQVNDILGRPVYKKVLNPEPHQVIRWDTKDWVAGAYIVSVSQNGAASSLTFNKL